MHFAIHLKTSKFDISKEDENPINPIYGQSLLVWLKCELKDNIEISEIDAEDWGWYCFTEYNGSTYMLGASCFFEEGDDPNSELEWVFQVDKHRSFKDKLLGKNKMTIDDECLIFFRGVLEKASDINVLSIE